MDATFEEKQSILQLLIERIIVGEDTLEIRHIIPLYGPLWNSRVPWHRPNVDCVRMVCTTHLCHSTPGSSPRTAAFIPSWSSETIRRTPLRPRSSRHPGKHAGFSRSTALGT